MRVWYLRTLPKDSHQEFWEDKGNYDGAMLVANSTTKDRRPDPVFGEVYRVRCMEDGVRHHQGYVEKTAFKNQTDLTRPPAALAIADGDPNPPDSSSPSSSSDSSDSSDKHKKHKKHKQDKKGKKDKRKKKEKKNKKDKKDKPRKRGRDEAQLKSNMSAGPPRPQRHSR